MSSKSAIQRVVVMGLLVVSSLAGNAYADDISDANEMVALFKKTDPGLDRSFKSSVAYAVFPGVGKGAYIVGGAYGKGILYQGGKPVGRTSVTQATIGLQVGGQAYAEIIFFETAGVLNDFKSGTFAFSGQVSGVALSSGAAANANYEWGVAVFTHPKGGLMVEASVGGQKFSYTPFEKKT